MAGVIESLDGMTIVGCAFIYVFSYVFSFTFIEVHSLRPAQETEGEPGRSPRID